MSKHQKISINVKKKKKNFMAPFYGWGSTASRLEPLQGGSLLFTTKFPETPQIPSEIPPSMEFFYIPNLSATIPT